MDKKKSIFIAILVVILVVVLAVVLASNKDNDVETNEPNNNQVQNNQGQESDIPLAENEKPVSRENIFVIDEDGFSPKTLYGEVGKRVFITFESTDGERHIIASEDPALADIFLVVIEEDEEPKSVAFMAPDAGTYTFYVDDKSNTGTIVIE